MDSLDGSLPVAVGDAGPRRPATVRRSLSAAASLGNIADERAKPPLPPRRGIDYDVNGHVQPCFSGSRVMPGQAAAGPVAISTVRKLSYTIGDRFDSSTTPRVWSSPPHMLQGTATVKPSNPAATDKYATLVSATRFTLRSPVTRSISVIESLDAVPTEVPLKQTRRPMRLAPPPPKLPPTPQPRALLSPKRLRCISEPTDGDCHAEDTSRPASENDAYALLGTMAPQRRQPDVLPSSPNDVAFGKSDGGSSRVAEAASGVPLDEAATAPAVLAAPTAQMADRPAPTAVDRVLALEADEVYVVCKFLGVTFRSVRFVASPASTAEPKPDSLKDCELPIVVWHPDELQPSTCDRGGHLATTPLKLNRCHTEPLLPPTLEEDGNEEEENGDDYYSSDRCPIPLQPAPSRPRFFGSSFRESSNVAVYSPDSNSDYVDPVSISSTRTEHLSKTEAKEGESLPKEVADRRRKEEEKKLRKIVKRQKEDDKLRRAQEKAEKKEQQRREKDEQKRAAELQKLLSQYKVSSADPPICEAIVNKDNLKPEKNELPVHAGERLLILAKDAKGRWLARSSSSGSNAIGIVTSSNLLLTETDTRVNGKSDAVDNSEGIYEELNR